MAGIKIDGIEYELPLLSTLELDEAIILQEHSGKTLDVIELEARNQQFDAGVLKGLMHVAIARVRPELAKTEISARLGKFKIAELAEAFAPDEQKPEAKPGDPPTIPNESTEGEKPSGKTSSGDGVTSPEASTLADTGSLDSDGKPASDRLTSVG